MSRKPRIANRVRHRLFINVSVVLPSSLAMSFIHRSTDHRWTSDRRRRTNFQIGGYAVVGKSGRAKATRPDSNGGRWSIYFEQLRSGESRRHLVHRR